jgi:hypothetical protein
MIASFMILNILNTLNSITFSHNTRAHFEQLHTKFSHSFSLFSDSLKVLKPPNLLRAFFECLTMIIYSDIAQEAFLLDDFREEFRQWLYFVSELSFVLLADWEMKVPSKAVLWMSSPCKPNQKKHNFEATKCSLGR